MRHARRLLHERASAGQDLSEAREQLRKQFAEADDEIQKLRALWTLYVMDDWKQDELIELLGDPNPHLRRWAVRLLVADTHPVKRRSQR